MLDPFTPDPLDPNRTKPTYRLSKKDKVKNRPPELELLKQNEKKLMIFFGCTPMTLNPNNSADGSVHIMKMRCICSGSIGFKVSENHPKRPIDYEFMKGYTPAVLERLRLKPNHKLKPGMHVFHYQHCGIHADSLPEFAGKHFIRGIIQGPIQKHDEEVKVFLIDEMVYASFPRKELYFAQLNIHSLECQSTMAVLDGLEILQKDPNFDETLKEFLDRYFEKDVKVAFKFDDKKKYHKATVHLMDGTSLNDLIWNEMIAKSKLKIPKETARGRVQGYICHAEPDGFIYIHGKNSLVNVLADWLQTDGDEITTDLMAVDNHPFNPLKRLENPVNMDTMYVAPYEGCLYRAKIIEQKDADNFNVQFIDYGNTAIVPRNEIYFASQVHPKLIDIPIQCHKFHLKFVGEIVDMKKFQNMWNDTLFDIDIRLEKFEDVRRVALLDNGMRINDMIIKNGWAVVEDRLKTQSEAGSVGQHGGRN